MGNQTRRASLGCVMCSLYVWHSLPLFVGAIPVPRPASHGPVRRDGGAENDFEILGPRDAENIITEEHRPSGSMAGA